MVIAAIRRVLLWWLVTAFLYPVFMTVLLALGRVMRAAGERAALRTLEWMLRGVGLFGVVAVVVSHVWFALIPIDQFTGDSWAVFSPFPLGSIDVETSPTTTS